MSEANDSHERDPGKFSRAKQTAGLFAFLKANKAFGLASRGWLMDPRRLNFAAQNRGDDDYIVIC